jgi:hypothetical protein
MCQCGEDAARSAEQRQARVKNNAVASEEAQATQEEDGIPVIYVGEEDESAPVETGNTTCVSVKPGVSSKWCSQTCASGDCPGEVCKCGDEALVPRATCIAIQPDGSDDWCTASCATGVCPRTVCKCEGDDDDEGDAPLTPTALRSAPAASNATANGSNATAYRPWTDAKCVSTGAFKTPANDHWCATTCSPPEFRSACNTLICKCPELTASQADANKAAFSHVRAYAATPTLDRQRRHIHNASARKVQNASSRARERRSNASRKAARRSSQEALTEHSELWELS